MSHRIDDATMEGFPTIRLHAEAAGVVAQFAPSVGMIGCSLTHRGEEVLGTRKGLKAYSETGSTMGIPFLHPWANRLAECAYRIGGKSYRFNGASPRLHNDANGLPIHGALGAHPGWEVVERGADGEKARLATRFDFAADPELMALFPFPHELRQEILLSGPALTIRTTLRATGKDSVPVSVGYHPYFTLPGVPRADFVLGLPLKRQMVLNEGCIPTGVTKDVHFDTAPLGDRQFDDLFCALESPPVFTLSGGARRISVSFDENYPIAVVFAPPGQNFVCFEPMTAPTNALLSGWSNLKLVAPGKAYTATFTIRVDQE
jgi:galactose mutarotase-like enzyme